MRERFQNYFATLFSNIREKWNSLDKPGKRRLYMGIGVLVLAIGLTLFLTLRPKYVLLINNQDISTISEAKSILDESGIVSKLTNGGRSLEVKEQDAFEAEVLVSSHTKAKTVLSSDDKYTYTDYFENSGIGVSESVKKEMEKSALQTRLEKIISNMDGISDAMVVLNIPETNGLFLKDNEQTTASVFLIEDDNLTKGQAEAVANAVKSGVKGLTLENITITNQHKELIYPSGSSNLEQFANEYELELQKKREIQQDIYTTLKPLYDDVQVTISLKIDKDKTTEESLEYIPSDEEANTGVIGKEKRTKESATGTGGAIEGEPGYYSNDQITDSYMTEQTSGGQDFSASKKDDEIDYKVGERIRKTEKGYGEIIKDESSIAIVVYEFVTYDEEKMRENGLLEDTSWYEFKQSNKPTMLEIDPELEVALRQGTGFENIGIVGYELSNFVDAVETPVDWQQIFIFAILALLVALLAFGLIRRSRVESLEEEYIEEFEPELEVEDLLVSTKLEEEKEAEVEKLQEIDYTKESEVKKEIDKFVDEKPDAVAQLLRNWLQEDWE